MNAYTFTYAALGILVLIAALIGVVIYQTASRRLDEREESQP